VKSVSMIPIGQIRVLNPRHRNKGKFTEIVQNISNIGLKKPITIAPRGPGESGYDLVCGQGRLEAFIALGHTEVPAFVVDASKEDRLLMSLVENMARRNPRPLEFVAEIAALKERGYNPQQIAAKTDLSLQYVTGLLRLHQQGEVKLLQAVQRGDIPVSVAIEIASADDASVQKALAEAYERGDLRGRALKVARRLAESRKTNGKKPSSDRRKKQTVSADQLVRSYKREAERQKLLVKKARLCERRLRFVTTAFGELIADDNFVNLLRAEKLESMPKHLEERIRDQAS